MPPGLRDAHYAGAKKLGHGKTYDYPHAHPDGVVPQQYPPDALVGKDYYRPTSRGRRGADRRAAGQAAGDRPPDALSVRRGPTAPAARDYCDHAGPAAAGAYRRTRTGARVSAGEIAGLIAAGALVLLVVLLAVPLLKLGPHARRDHADHPAGPRAEPRRSSTQANTTVAHVNSNLERVDDITGNAANVSSNVAALTSVVAATLGSPLIKVAAFSYGVRSADARRSVRAQALAEAAQPRQGRAARPPRRPAGRLMRRLFWLAMGITIGALVVRKLSRGRRAS